MILSLGVHSDVSNLLVRNWHNLRLVVATVRTTVRRAPLPAVEVGQRADLGSLSDHKINRADVVEVA